MMRTKSLWAVLGCVAVLGLAAGCSDDDDSVCGDGVAEGSEACDLNDLKGQTCFDVTGDTEGTLLCGDTCSFDIELCGSGCGNGIEEFGEECDCGQDPQNLPAGCTAVNGGTNANCTAACEEIDLCGDGVRTGMEECDCGDPAMVTAPGDGCSVYNGEMDATCDSSCAEISVCELDPFEGCNPLVGDPPTHGCCPDDWGNEYTCETSPFTTGDANICAMPCTSAADCYWNNTCLSALGTDMCYIAICSPGSAIVDAELNGPCQAAGGEPGYCASWGRYSDTHEFYGYCLENGDLEHGDTCPDVPIFDTDRTADGGAAAQMCNAGICIGPENADGVCSSFCDWEAEYDGVILGTDAPFCPAGSNCWAESTISEDQYNLTSADYGWRGGNLAYCRPTEATSATLGITSCSLVTGELLSDTTSTCANSHTDGICTPIRYSNTYIVNACPNGQTDCTSGGTCDTSTASYYFGYCTVEGAEYTFGSLIGRCIDGPATVLNVWDPCDPATDLCATGTWCAAEDAFGAGTGETVCVPYCDTNVHTGLTACQDLGAPGDTGDGTPVCTSISLSYPAWTNGTLSGGGGADDTEPSRLGLCAFPAP